MNKLDKQDLISTIGRELQDRMTFSDIEAYLKEYDIPTDHNPNYNSKWVYVKEVLAGVDDEIVLDIAKELKINHSAISKIPIVKDDEASFWKPGHFRLFLSHLSSYKKKAGILKDCLEKYGISAFVAHEDIQPTKLWQKEIEKGLFSMDALCALIMPGFKESDWTDQEVGVAIGRGVLVISIRKNMDPYGFIGKFQGFQSKGKSIQEVAKGIFLILSTHEKTRSLVMNKLIDLFLMSNSAIEAHPRIDAIKLIDNIPLEKIKNLRSRLTDNENLDQSNLIKSFNELMVKYDMPMVDFKEFEKKKEDEWDDDLPF